MPEDHDSRVLIRRALAARRAPKKPESADVELGGVETDTDWDEPATDWMQEKQAAVRRVLAALVNDPDNLPQIGRRVDRIVRQTGAADIYFDDGSWVSATVDDPQPATSEEAEVVERVYGDTPRKLTRDDTAGAESLVMVAAVRDGELLGAMDARRRGATDGALWRLRVASPFDLYVLRGVPRELARELDVAPRGVRPRCAREAWTTARRHADPRPLRRVP